MKIASLRLERVGQIQTGHIAFGDLTVLVGPQATGKSILLQFLKLVADTGYVHYQLLKYGIDWDGLLPEFLDVFLGEGMRKVWHEGDSASQIIVDEKPIDAAGLARLRRRKQTASLFYIPAQRVLSLANGWPRPFTAFGSQDPFIVRDFSETFRILMEQELFRTDALFPKTNRLKKEYRNLLSRHIFGGFGLGVDRYGSQKRLVLRRPEAGLSIPYMAWSAGQREFVPLLMGLYWLFPPAKTPRKEEIEWVIIEEPEMGLHPNAISVVLLLVVELLWRGYRVCLSTHSPYVLDVVWALRMIQREKADPSRLLDVFGVAKTDPMKRLAQEVYRKDARVYYFDRKGFTKDISGLDPASEDTSEVGWGGLTEFSGRVNDVVASLVKDTN